MSYQDEMWILDDGDECGCGSGLPAEDCCADGLADEPGGEWYGAWPVETVQPTGGVL